MSSDALDKHKSIDLISYQNDGEGCMVIAGEYRKSANEHVGRCIDMRADEMLISACV